MSLLSARPARRYASTLAALGLLVLCGCGDERPGLLPLAGRVSLDGQPLEGDILFLPIGKGTTAGAKIQNGQFRIEQAKGLLPGRYRVEVVSYQPTGRKVPDTDFPGQMKDELAQVVPAQYNTDSTLEADISADSAEALQFELTTAE